MRWAGLDVYCAWLFTGTHGLTRFSNEQNQTNTRATMLVMI